MPARPVPNPARRTLLHTAWAAPLVVTATAAPAFASSGGVIVLTLKYSLAYNSDGSYGNATFSYTVTRDGAPVTDTAKLLFTYPTLGTSETLDVTVTNGSGTKVLTSQQYISYTSRYQYVQLTYGGQTTPRQELTAY